MKLDQQKILKLTNLTAKHVFIFNQIDSTMIYAQQHSFDGINLILASQQTAGKGQRGHSFNSPTTGLYATIIVPAKDEFLKSPGMLTVGVGVAVQQAIKQVLGIETQLKWVNDIYVRQQKCGGVLVEVKSNNQNVVESFIIGIGLNLTYHESLKSVKATGLTDTDEKKNELIAAIYNLVVKMYQHPQPNQIGKAYQNHLIWQNQLVSVNYRGLKMIGKIDGVTPDFKLRLIDKVGQHHLLTAAESEHIREI
ncbi:biotin--[acetyl-CoA-carboxylase] ligase [Fructilactobacillus lindneri]|uniref:BPL/LPL catalytic domain-containing protein n=2 Tax=Fructilactobacillus lindneri TaxID=53444 RepID=A0A0R2JSB4_9LACO|nr:biotin--[acetyl-CoA-carboxylase] ligase [Fructilactobacillus lindneri]ANZ57810.1 hypothetical protein AYR60_03035 [Fructilactobacillus lindneri]ANZ59079.1 hypothetical protein AYR59_03035 [Fructilactobacillus lindneri]KRN78742.1 hypothetical protein IV52_GL001020 [Fructilactobacillus lindneri DSM 20690 = JCM 11027]POG98133.1 biotin--[acetyl-CoA-carboxylase] ligase [Fructilactobacillus lindneri]POH01752.1 biotin--[acetyl-CoA-carboxylase] ligase [Fructilactobacillus lindneri]